MNNEVLSGDHITYVSGKEKRETFYSTFESFLTCPCK